MRTSGLLLCSVLLACAPTRYSPRAQETVAGRLSTLEQECNEKTVLALCDSEQCELYWCRAVAPYLAAGSG
jgi:CMP-2-keto-3-deoxyoctulosonic acid synthetase